MFRFTIRDLLWLMVVVGMGLILWAEHKSMQQEQSEKESQIFWSKTLERSIEREGFKLGDGDLGYIDLIPIRRKGAE